MGVAGHVALPAARNHVGWNFSLFAEEVVTETLHRRRGFVDEQAQDDLIADVTQFNIVGGRHPAHHLIVTKSFG